MRSALLLDRDGVVIRDIDLLTDPDQLELLPGVATEIAAAQRAGLAVVVITNQSVVARGLCSDADVEEVHRVLDRLLVREGTAPLDGFYYCPHHPHADVEAYRIECECRKPKPGMLEQAAREHDIDLDSSVMIGDRMSDVLAGHRVGCATVLVESEAADAPLIVGVQPEDLVEPSFRASDSAAAIRWAVARMQPEAS